LSYGANFPELRAGEFVDKVLHGAKPGDPPVEQPTKFDLIINLQTAKALNITIPQLLLVRADATRLICAVVKVAWGRVSSF
jgi:putative ABC transport system substrate-binding protein